MLNYCGIDLTADASLEERPGRKLLGIHGVEQCWGGSREEPPGSGKEASFGVHEAEEVYWGLRETF